MGAPQKAKEFDHLMTVPVYLANLVRADPGNINGGNNCGQKTGLVWVSIVHRVSELRLG